MMKITLSIEIDETPCGGEQQTPVESLPDHLNAEVEHHILEQDVHDDLEHWDDDKQADHEENPPPHHHEDA